MPDPHGTHTNVDVGEGDGEQRHPRPSHVPAIEAARTVVRDLARGAARQLIDVAAHDVTHRMAAQRVATEEHDVRGENERSHADAEMFDTASVDEPERLPYVVRQKDQEEQRYL